MKVVAIGTENCWSVEHEKLSGTFNFDCERVGKMKREERMPMDIPESEEMHAIYSDPRQIDNVLERLTWGEFNYEIGINNAWFEVGPQENNSKIRALINLATQEYLVEINSVWTLADDVHWKSSDIIGAFQYIDTKTLKSADVSIDDALDRKFFKLVCASQNIEYAES